MLRDRNHAIRAWETGERASEGDEYPCVSVVSNWVIVSSVRKDVDHE